MTRKLQSIKIIAGVAIIIIIILSVHLFINKYIDNINKQIIDDVHKLKSALEEKDFSKSSDIADDLKNIWMTHVDILPIFIDHNDIDFVTTSIIQMESYIKSQEAAFALASAETVIEKIESIKLKEKLTLVNVF